MSGRSGGDFQGKKVESSLVRGLESLLAIFRKNGGFVGVGVAWGGHSGGGKRPRARFWRKLDVSERELMMEQRKRNYEVQRGVEKEGEGCRAFFFKTGGEDDLLWAQRTLIADGLFVYVLYAKFSLLSMLISFSPYKNIHCIASLFPLFDGRQLRYLISHILCRTFCGIAFSSKAPPPPPLLPRNTKVPLHQTFAF